jgi:hypothetical protein
MKVVVRTYPADAVKIDGEPLQSATVEIPETELREPQFHGLSCRCAGEACKARGLLPRRPGIAYTVEIERAA